LIIDKTVRRLKSVPARRQTDLLATVSLLTDLLEQASIQPDGPDFETMRNVAELALTNAIEADQKLIDQGHRIDDLERMVVTDPLTGLLNRRGVADFLRNALASARRYDEQGVLMSIDLDGFKFINDTYGHNAGDTVLKQVARVLSENVRETDRVGRVGGDEFVVILSRVSGELGIKRARHLNELLNNTLVNIDGRAILLRASFGAQVFGCDDDGDDLLNRADHAMYENKRNRSDKTRSTARN
jgi:diguanylate cyclase (GGDEF)-like protein